MPHLFAVRHTDVIDVLSLSRLSDMKRLDSALTIGVSVLVALALALAGCGSDSAETTDTTALPQTTTPQTTTTMDSTTDEDDGDGHAHGHEDALEVDLDDPIPTVAIDVTETDVAGTYQLLVALTDFTVTPDAVDTEPVANEGHMHLLVDGAKVDRFYETTREFELEPGEHIVEVELNGNDHRAWTVEGARINATQLVIVPGDVADEPEPDPADVTISASYADGVVTVDGGDRVEVPLDSTVAIVITSDVTEEVHLHGYDLFADVGPDREGIIAFTADIAGKFEAELEGAGQFLVELVVS